jgi:flavin-dependent dehydrogenase
MTKPASEQWWDDLKPTTGGVDQPGRMALADGSRVAVIGGGPAGSFFSLFLLELAERVQLKLQVDLFEAKDFRVPGPAGCNMCGGVVSESLVQLLAAEGINLPPTVVVRGIDSYVLHMDVGVVRIKTPLQEMRIAAVYRGAGPRGLQGGQWHSFDGFLLGLAAAKGVRVVPERVETVTWSDGRPQVKTRSGSCETYDLLVGAVGVNSATLKAFEGLGINYRPPRATKTYIAEFFLGEEAVTEYLGHAMHVFLLNLPRLEFAALIPKGGYVTFCLLGQDIDEALVRSFFETEEVRQCMPPGWRRPEQFCHCSPRIAVGATGEPFADRAVFIGDCGVSRLYKDGIGSAYRTAKAAARAVVFDGISREDLRRHFWPACQAITRDNWVGRLVFMVTRLIQQRRFARLGMLRMVSREQTARGGPPRMSMVLWDTFTGSASYWHVFCRTLHPFFGGRLFWETLKGLWPARRS